MQAVKTGAHGFKKFYDGVQYVLEIEPVLTIRRIIWIVLGGWMVAGLFLFAGLVLCLTIVGIPMGLEAFRWSLCVPHILAHIQRGSLVNMQHSHT
jgi:hypothetical protein